MDSLTKAQQQDILNRLEAGERQTVLAKEYRKSRQYIHQLDKKLREESGTTKPLDDALKEWTAIIKAANKTATLEKRIRTLERQLSDIQQEVRRLKAPSRIRT